VAKLMADIGRDLARRIARRFEKRRHIGARRFHDMREHSGKHLVLAGEMIGDDAFGNARLRRDPRQRGPRIPLARQHRDRRRDDLLSPCLLDKARHSPPKSTNRPDFRPIGLFFKPAIVVNRSLTRSLLMYRPVALGPVAGAGSDGATTRVIWMFFVMRIVKKVAALAVSLAALTSLAGCTSLL